MFDLILKCDQLAIDDSVAQDQINVHQIVFAGYNSDTVNVSKNSMAGVLNVDYDDIANKLTITTQTSFGGYGYIENGREKNTILSKNCYLNQDISTNNKLYFFGDVLNINNNVVTPQLGFVGGQFNIAGNIMVGSPDGELAMFAPADYGIRCGDNPGSGNQLFVSGDLLSKIDPQCRVFLYGDNVDINFANDFTINYPKIGFEAMNGSVIQSGAGKLTANAIQVTASNAITLPNVSISAIDASAENVEISNAGDLEILFLGANNATVNAPGYDINLMPFGGVDSLPFNTLAVTGELKISCNSLVVAPSRNELFTSVNKLTAQVNDLKLVKGFNRIDNLNLLKPEDGYQSIYYAGIGNTRLSANGNVFNAKIWLNNSSDALGSLVFDGDFSVSALDLNVSGSVTQSNSKIAAANMTIFAAKGVDLRGQNEIANARIYTGSKDDSNLSDIYLNNTTDICLGDSTAFAPQRLTAIVGGKVDIETTGNIRISENEYAEQATLKSGQSITVKAISEYEEGQLISAKNGLLLQAQGDIVFGEGSLLYTQFGRSTVIVPDISRVSYTAADFADFTPWYNYNGDTNSIGAGNRFVYTQNALLNVNVGNESIQLGKTPLLNNFSVSGWITATDNDGNSVYLASNNGVYSPAGQYAILAALKNNAKNYNYSFTQNPATLTIIGVNNPVSDAVTAAQQSAAQSAQQLPAAKAQAIPQIAPALPEQNAFDSDVLVI